MADMKTYTSSEPRIRYWQSAGEDQRVLLVMGFGMRGQIWQPQIDGLGASYRLAWYDHRGLGDSEKGPASRWSIRDMAEDAYRVLDALGWSRCHLVGVSMGGMIAQEMVLNQEERFASLSLLVTHGGGSPLKTLPGQRGMRAFMRSFLARGEGKAKALEALLYPDAFLECTDRARLRSRIRKRIERPAPPATLLAQLMAVFGHNSLERIGRIAVPTQIIKATEDILVSPRFSDELKRAIPLAQLYRMEGAGHGVIFQCADRINALLAAHIERNRF
ncbi:MAG: alpha/beta fold hydrolase [Bradymonadia bacterium]